MKVRIHYENIIEEIAVDKGKKEVVFRTLKGDGSDGEKFIVKCHLLYVNMIYEMAQIKLDWDVEEAAKFYGSYLSE